MARLVIDPVTRIEGHLRVEVTVDGGVVTEGTVNLSSPRAIFAGLPPRFTRSCVTYEAYAVSRTSTRPQVDSAPKIAIFERVIWSASRQKSLSVRSGGAGFDRFRHGARNCPFDTSHLTTKGP